MEAFTTGKISTPDLNDAQEPKNEARQKYVSEFYYHWHRSHQLRSLTLWDSKRNMELEADLEDIIRG